MRLALVMLGCLFMFAVQAGAREIEGVEIVETRQGGDGTVLHLNGAGIREKFFFDIYIAALYLAEPSSDVEKVLSSAGEKQIVMHFLYSEVSKEKLVDAWNEGFEENVSKDMQATLKNRITAFNNMFVGVTKNDVITLNYAPEKGTEVTIAGKAVGVVDGKDFNDALLKIWLGKEPVTSSLKKDLLRYNK